MDFGLTAFPADYAIAPAELGRAAEDAGAEEVLALAAQYAELAARHR